MQIVGYPGLNYNSLTLAAAIRNLVPGFTFLLAIIFRSNLLCLVMGRRRSQCGDVRRPNRELWGDAGRLSSDYVRRVTGRSAWIFKRTGRGTGERGDRCIEGRCLAGILKKNGVNSDGILYDQRARMALAFVTLRAGDEH
ncbi:fructokinase [Sarracenia purpurea var. burkii]